MQTPAGTNNTFSFTRNKRRKKMMKYLID